MTVAQTLLHIQDMSCHGYECVMSVLCTPLQVKCYRVILLYLSLSYILII